MWGYIVFSVKKKIKIKTWQMERETKNIWTRKTTGGKNDDRLISDLTKIVDNRSMVMRCES